jgi:hypothetical protein
MMPPDGGRMMPPDGGMMMFPDGGMMMFPDGGGRMMFPDGGGRMMFPDGGGMMPPQDGSGNHWMSALDEAGCAPGVSLIEMGGPILSMPTVGSGGGYGGFYCFSLVP